MANSQDVVVRVAGANVTLERFAEIYAFREYELESLLVYAYRAGLHEVVADLYGRQRVLPFETLEWVVDALVAATFAHEVDVVAGEDVRRSYLHRKIGLTWTLDGSQTMVKAHRTHKAALEELRITLCLTPSSFQDITALMCTREQVALAVCGEEEAELWTLGVSRSSYGQPTEGSHQSNDRFRRWLDEHNATIRIERFFDSTRYDWLLGCVLPIRETWWPPFPANTQPSDGGP